MLKTQLQIRKGELGFSLIELMIVMVLIAIVSTFAMLGIARARASINLQNSMRLLSGYMEKARLDAIRRHESSIVEFVSPGNLLRVTMDFDGNGTKSTRTFELPAGINSVISAASDDDYPIVEFNWRGRTTQCYMAFQLQNTRGESTTLSVTNAGDITVDTNLGATVSPGNYSSVNQSGDIASSTAISSTTVSPCLEPCSTCVPPAGPVQSTGPTGCSAFTVNKSSITIRKNGGSTDSFIITAPTADNVTAKQSDGKTNLQFLPGATQSVTAGGTKTYTLKSLNNSKGKFPVVFNSSCSSASVIVTVTN
jgi:prepilin-type N-terminal cleavage/methylation domain-containing protein